LLPDNLYVLLVTAFTQYSKFAKQKGEESDEKACI
jgi:hypothetical protein